MTGLSGVSWAGARLQMPPGPDLVAGSRVRAGSEGVAASAGAGLQVAPGGPSGGSFGEVLGRALEELSLLENRADELTARLARGEPVELHEVIIATEKVQLALDLAVQLRNRVVEAYQEIMRMPV